MPAPPTGTATVFRLARITALVAGSLLFLYACEMSTGTLFWAEIAVAGGLLLAALGCAWFEVARRDAVREPDVPVAPPEPDPPVGEFRLRSGNWLIRARIVGSGDLVLRGRDLSGAHPDYEWAWTFRPDTFPAIRAALGETPADLLALLDRAVPLLDPLSRQDPGAWLHLQGIPGTIRERGVSPSQTTRELPIIEFEPPRRSLSGPHLYPRRRTGAARDYE